MRELLLIAAALLCLTSAASARTEARAGVAFENYRPIGEFRLWTLIVRDSVVGRLTSKVESAEQVDGLEGYRIDEALELDFSRASNLPGAPRYRLESRHFVAADGTYLGDEIEMEVNGEEAELELKRRGDELIGHFTRSGREVPQTIEWADPLFAVDNFLLDQLELFLAMHDITVGDTLEADIFVPQDLSVSRLQAVVASFEHYQLYRGHFDSVFVIRFLAPQPMVAYYSPARRLSKIHILSNDLKAYLDVVRKEPISGQSRSAGAVARHMVSLIPGYIFYTMVGLVAGAMFVGREYRRRLAYAALAVGAGGFLITTVTTIPLQMWALQRYLVPAAIRGASPYWLGLGPAIASGVIHELLKLGLLVALLVIAKRPATRARGLGAALGAGFGIVWACHLATINAQGDPFSWALLERGFTMLFHAASGALLGEALLLRSRGARWWHIPLVLIAINALIHYIPVFVQRGIVPVKLMHLLIPLVVLVLALWALLWFRRDPSTSA